MLTFLNLLVGWMLQRSEALQRSCFCVFSRWFMICLSCFKQDFCRVKSKNIELCRKQWPCIQRSPVFKPPIQFPRQQYATDSYWTWHDRHMICTCGLFSRSLPIRPCFLTHIYDSYFHVNIDRLTPVQIQKGEHICLQSHIPVSICTLRYTKVYRWIL